MTTTRPMYRVYAIAPTVYQLNSLSFFGAPKERSGGHFEVVEYFDSKEDAIAYLHRRIDYYAATNGTEEEIAAMREDADNGYVTYDSVTGGVQEAEYHSDDESDVTWS